MGLKDHLPGLSVVLLIAVLSYALSLVHASFDPLVISIITGVIAGNLSGPRARLGPGADASLRIFLPVGIAFYGSQLVLTDFGWKSGAAVFVVFAALFLLTLFATKIFGLSRPMSILLASGLSICGASAIAIISPLIGARKEDTSIAVISVMMVGLVGMVSYPILHDLLLLSDTEFAFLSGTTLPMLGQVKVTAGSVCPGCLSTALNLKLLRISFLLFLVTLAVTLAGRGGKKIRVPWFVGLFLVFAVVANATELLSSFARQLRFLSAFSLSAGLAAIGLRTDFETVIEEGANPLVAVFCSWIIIILLLYLVRNLAP